ncbi:amidase [Bisporella sp. PMI_857]|nr:amidase [Bisporella sp. PMI_857]
MFYPTWKRLWGRLINNLSAGDISLRYWFVASSYQLLPTSSFRLQDTLATMPQTGIHRSSLALLLGLLFLLLISGVTAGLMRKPSYSMAEFPKLIDATIETLTEGLARNKFTSVDLVKAYLARISEVNDALHAVDEVNPEALAIASQLDIERSAGKIRGPLHGIPLLIKNNIATNDQMNTTAGSWALLGAKVPRDATVAQKLREAGAILLGKAHMSQWANFRSLNSSNGWSAIGGQAYGPYFPHEDPEGSSSGCGIASALGLTLGCVGTETDGSILAPAEFNNLVGIKPTVGLTSRHLVIPISEHYDTVGPLSRNVKDAAHILQAIAGVDPRDNYTSAIPAEGDIPDYISACTFSALSGSRLGIPRDVISLNLNADNTSGPRINAFNQALGILKAAGATIVEDTNFTASTEYFNSQLSSVLRNADIVVNLPGYLELLTYNPKNITSLADLRNFTQTYPLEDYPNRDTGLWDAALQPDAYNNTDPRFWPAYQQNMYYNGDGGLIGAIERNNLDAVILPTKFAYDQATTIGAPIVTVPLGFYPVGVPVVSNSWGLVESAPHIPFGLSFLGARFSDANLIGMAYAFEQRTKIGDKLQPYIVPKTELENVIGKKR